MQEGKVLKMLASINSFLQEPHWVEEKKVEEANTNVTPNDLLNEQAKKNPRLCKQLNILGLTSKKP